MGRILNTHALCTPLGRKTQRRAKGTTKGYFRKLRIESLESRRVLATTYTVTTAFDEDDGILVGGISLRDAIQEANNGDLINFDTSQMGTDIIALDNLKGHISFGTSITIDASMLENGITIDANDFDRGHTNEARGNGNRIFEIIDPTNGSAPPSVLLKKLTLTGGDILSTGKKRGQNYLFDSLSCWR